MGYVVAVDLGGSKTVTALVKNSIVIKKLKHPTHQEKGKKYVLSNLFKDINMVMQGVDKDKIIGIGVAAPSVVDTKNGIVLFPPNLKGWKNVPLKDILQKKFKMPVVVENDSNLAALGEYAIYNSETLVCLMLGTGVGGGLVVEGKIYNGINSAMEIGHMIIGTDSNVKCSCGNLGCFESFVSGKAIVNRYKLLSKSKKDITTIEIAELARKGNKNAKKAISESTHYLTVGLINIINIFDPDVITINGGISKIKELVNPVIKNIKNKSLVAYKGEIMLSKLGSDSILIGAEYLLRDGYFLRPVRSNKLNKLY